MARAFLAAIESIAFVGPELDEGFGEGSGKDLRPIPRLRGPVRPERCRAGSL